MLIIIKKGIEIETAVIILASQKSLVCRQFSSPKLGKVDVEMGVGCTEKATRMIKRQQQLCQEGRLTVSVAVYLGGR